MNCALAGLLMVGLACNASQFSVEQRATAHGPEVVLRDNVANTTAVVLPSDGFNCWRFTLAPTSGAPIEFLAGPADPATLGKGGSGFGWPILFPFPNRVANGEFTFGGKTCRFPLRTGMKHAIHGFVLNQPWRVTATSSEGGAAVTGVTDTESNPALKEHWPWPCRLTVTYRLAGRALTMTAVAENLGTEPMPFGFGVHPYHPLPLTPAGARARCEIQVPCREQLELTPDCIPTSRRLPMTTWRTFHALGDVKLDDVFTGTSTDANGSACVLRDPDSHWEVTMQADAGFQHWVVYAPKRDVVCFEPYTCVTDAFNLHARGVPDTGFAVLEPGKPWRGVVTMSIREFSAEPTNAKEAAAKRAAADKVIDERFQKWKATLSPEQQAWETTLEQNLGSFYLPLYKSGRVKGSEQAWDYVKDDPALPRVLLIGDSVSRGYTLAARKALAGKVNVHRAPENCGPTANGLKKLDIWLGDGKWAVIHFNFGIHDRNTKPDVYEKNLEQLIERMQKTGAKLIWASTTPIPADGKDGPNAPASIVEHNAIAARVMQKHGIAIDDLFTAVTPKLGEYQNPKDVHFNAAGYEFLGQQVANVIKEALK